MLRKFFLSLLILLVLFAFWQAALLGYLMQLAKGQFSIVWDSRPVEVCLEDHQLADSIKQKLLFIEDVRKFAIDSLGLIDTDNYTTFYDQKGSELVWVVQACKPFDLSPYQWHFPIVGDLPYKGYFDREEAIALAASLEEEHYDVSIQNPSGWSTLGWFSDPILSGMLQRSEGRLANLILHEMTHATIFVPDDATFNENLATFIADSSTYIFLAHRFGKLADQYIQYQQNEEDQKKITQHMMMGAIRLDSLYHTFSAADSMAYKLSRKESAIKEIMESFDTLSLNRPYRRRDGLPNNTMFMSYRLYHGEQSDLTAKFKAFNGDFVAFIRHLKQIYANE